VAGNKVCHDSGQECSDRECPNSDAYDLTGLQGNITFCPRIGLGKCGRVYRGMVGCGWNVGGDPGATESWSILNNRWRPTPVIVVRLLPPLPKESLSQESLVLPGVVERGWAPFGRNPDGCFDPRWVFGTPTVVRVDGANGENEFVVVNWDFVDECVREVVFRVCSVEEGAVDIESVVVVDGNDNSGIYGLRVGCASVGKCLAECTLLVRAGSWGCGELLRPDPL